MRKTTLVACFAWFCLLAAAADEVGASITAYYGPPAQADTWTEFTVPLTAASFGVDDVTFADALSSVGVFRICTELHDGTDEGSLDTVRIGAQPLFAADFTGSAEGWTASGDGTLYWQGDGGMPGGYLRVADWATGDWHYMVAPPEWSGDWRPLIGQDIRFYMKSTNPDYHGFIEIFKGAQPRLLITADPFQVAAGGTTQLTVGVNPAPSAALTVTLASSDTSLLTLRSTQATIPAGQTQALVLADATALLQGDKQAVITVSASGYASSRVTVVGPDTTPNAFSFTDVAKAAPATLVVSNALVVSGINTPAPIGVRGGQYRIDDGPWTSADGTISQGQQVTLRQTSSTAYGTTVKAMLTIGGVSDTWEVATIPLTTDITANYGPPAQANTWAEFTVPLTAASFGVDDVTFVDVLSSVGVFRISTELHDGPDEGSLDTVRIGAQPQFAADFTGSAEGWAASGDGTLYWQPDGGMPGGYLRVADWASGDWHYMVAPPEWSGDWSPLIGQNIRFFVKSTNPDYHGFIEIFKGAQPRLLITANPFQVAAGGATQLTVGVSPASLSALTVSLTSSDTGRLALRSTEVTIPAGQTQALVTADATAQMLTGDQAVITVAASGYASSRVTVVGMTADTVPDAFSFPALTRTPPSTPVSSQPITVAGINAPAPMTVSGGEYSLDGGEWTSQAGGVVNGQQVRLRQTSTARYNAAADTVLTIGGVSAAWTVRTMPLAGDINGDERVSLSDAVLGMRVAAGFALPAGSIGANYDPRLGDVNADGWIGLAEVIYILQKAAGLR